MQLYERLKYLRKNILKMTQDEFAKKINLSRSNLGSIETGMVNLTERNMIVICETFEVNEDWLRTGEGEVFREKTDEEEIASYMGRILKNSDVNADFQKRFIKIVSQLDSKSLRILIRFAEILAEENKKN